MPATKPRSKDKRSSSPKSGRAKTPKTPPGSRIGVRGELLKVKVSIAVPPTDLDWASAEAERRHVSLSTVFSDALRFVQRDAAWQRCFAALGDTAALTDDERAQTEAEFRELGLIR